MWLFDSKCKVEDEKLLDGWTDHHSHLLFGVDDGVKTLEESLNILNIMEEAGIKRLWLTPHIMEDVPNRPADLRNVFAQLKEAYKGPVDLMLAAENMLDNQFELNIKSGDLLPIGRKQTHLLVETSYYTPPFNLNKRFESIKANGLFPLLAHPERYRYMEEDDYKRLKDKGISFQLNLPSIVGAYGETVLKKARFLLKKGMYDCCGCDTHSLRGFLYSYHGKIKKSERKLLRELIANEI